ncbi:MAG: hypothetical protein ACRDP6_41100 [Actinoallomurus sp.]
MRFLTTMAGSTATLPDGVLREDLPAAGQGGGPETERQGHQEEAAAEPDRPVDRDACRTGVRHREETADDARDPDGAERRREGRLTTSSFSRRRPAGVAGDLPRKVLPGRTPSRSETRAPATTSCASR